MLLLAGVVAVIALWWLLARYQTADPGKLAGLLRRAAGVAGFIVAGVLLLRGRIDMALLVAGAAAWAYGELPFRLPFDLPFQNRRSGRLSRARTATLELTIDHDSGAVDGVILAGPQAGWRLGALAREEALALLGQLRRQEPAGAGLLEAYLDSRFPGWRKDADGDAHARRGPVGAGAMTEEEAYEVLGLAPGAGPEDIRRAHRALMKRLHPDHGGTTWLAARVNQARDILLARHR
ncbi:DnaJ domain-containing protein [Camelimonas abortus]|uniref:DnaJ domain-containing protein n=1 Tax=Camelimonas abortus TaxID=1017184 RepID=A0ABV7LFG5_9HYPH